MKKKRFRQYFGITLSAILILFSGTVAAENIDPEGVDARFAHGENIGWLNADPITGDAVGLEVANSRLTGYLWAENVGWISLSCENSSHCGSVDYGVANDGFGNLSGYAWSENGGWISFSCTNTASCPVATYGVTIDPVTGEFSGHAWGENMGWVKFDHAQTVHRVITALRDSDNDGVQDEDDPFPNDPNDPNETSGGSGSSGSCFVGSLSHQ